MTTTDEILSAYRKLPQKDKRALVDLLYKETETLQLDGSQAKHCPHCESLLITKSGFHDGEQCYQCGECKRTFKETTGTVLSGIRKKNYSSSFKTQ